MSTVGQVDAGITSNYDTSKTAKTSQSGNYGNTIGDVKLSDKAAKYYEELKSKNAGMDFVLVSNDQVDGAEQKAAKFATGRTMVLIDADKIEKMAEDEEYRKKYENIISNAGSQLEAMKNQLVEGSLGDIKTYGIRVDDNGNASYFAVVDKSLSAQKDRIEQQAAKRTEEKKAAAKDAKAKEAQERTERLRGKNSTDKTEGNYETYSASSVQELIKKINDGYITRMSDSVMTEQEKSVGSKFDFSL